MKIKDSGKRQEFGTGAVRDIVDDKPAWELLPMECLDRVAQWYQLGASKYAENNWRKGMPIKRTYGSMMRHASKYAQGMRDEDHLSAIVFNALAIMYYEMYYDIPEDDMPNWYKEGKPNIVD